MEQQKSIDWRLSLQLSNNQPEIARELMTMFMTDLPKLRAEIEVAYGRNQLDALLTIIHKLHGACCYVGVPQLKNIVAMLETQLKSNNEKSIDDLMQKLFHEMDSVTSDYNDEFLKKIRS